MPSIYFTQNIDNMLLDKTFSVTMGKDITVPKILNNGLPQGSVLPPLLFNLYIMNILHTKTRKFGYADD